MESPSEGNAEMAGPKGLDVEIYEGKVVAVWFGCLMLPFEVHYCKPGRGQEMKEAHKQMMEAVNSGKFDPMLIMQERMGQAYQTYEANGKPDKFVYTEPDEERRSREE